MSCLHFNSKDVSEVNITKAGDAIKIVEKNLLSQCPKRLKATFLIGKADYYIRKATRKGNDIRDHERIREFNEGNIYVPL